MGTEQRATGLREAEDGWKVISFEDGGVVIALYVVSANARSLVREAARNPASTGRTQPLCPPSRAKVATKVFCLANVRVSYPFPSTPSYLSSEQDPVSPREAEAFMHTSRRHRPIL